MCQHLHVLPQPGGLLNQDSFIIVGMDMVIEEQTAKEAEEQHRRELAEKRRRG